MGNYLDIPEELEERFEELKAAWKEQTAGSSSATKITCSIHYLRIIALGPAVVPLILRSMQKEPDHWFIALKVLTYQDPCLPHDNYQTAVCRWLDWGRQKGFI